MFFVDGSEEVGNEVADGLREEWLALPVKQEPAVRDLILRLKAEHYGMRDEASSGWRVAPSSGT